MSLMRFLTILLVLGAPAATMAQGHMCSEQAIRTAIRNGSTTATEDSFFWSGAFDKPLIGKAAQEAAGLKAKRDEPRKNSVSSLHPQKIEPSSSGDMAYEYGTGNLAYDEPETGKHTAFDLAYLRVWKASGGECKLAAEMYRPIESTIHSK